MSRKSAEEKREAVGVEALSKDGTHILGQQEREPKVLEEAARRRNAAERGSGWARVRTVLACGFVAGWLGWGCGDGEQQKANVAALNAELSRMESELAERIGALKTGAAEESSRQMTAMLDAGKRAVAGLPQGGTAKRVAEAQKLARFREGAGKLAAEVEEAAEAEKEAKKGVKEAAERLRAARKRFAEEVEPKLPDVIWGARENAAQLASWREQRLEKMSSGQYATFAAFHATAAEQYRAWGKWTDEAERMCALTTGELRQAVDEAGKRLVERAQSACEARERQEKALAELKRHPFSRALVSAARKDTQGALRGLKASLDRPPEPGWMRDAENEKDTRANLKNFLARLAAMPDEEFMEKSVQISKATEKLEKDVADVVASAAWTEGARHPTKPHVFATSKERTWDADPGYWFVRPGTNSDLVVQWMPGQSHPEHPHVTAGQREGTWEPDPGYKARWKGDLDPVWTQGERHPTKPHVFATSEERTWDADPGYLWVNPGTNGDLSVRWEAGLRNPEHPHVFSGVAEGTWEARPGYTLRWNGDLDPRWTPGARHPEYPHISASDEEATWVADPGYVPEEPNTGNLAVRWEPGQLHPYYPHIHASEQEGKWVPDDGYRYRSMADDGDFSVEWVGW